MADHFTEFTRHLELSAQLAGNAILNALRLPDVIREGVGNVLLAGVSTSAAAVAAARVRFAIRVARRLPFASPQSICAAAFDAATIADKYGPYAIMVETFFGDPVAMIALGTFNSVPGANIDAAADIKATALLALLAKVPELNDVAALLSILVTPITGLTSRAQTLRTAVGKQLDLSDYLNGKPLDQPTSHELDELITRVEKIPVIPADDGLWAGVPKVLNAAVRGTKRITDAVLAQHEALCGAGRKPARGFYERLPDTISLDRTYPSIPAGDGSWALLVARDDSALFAVTATDEQSRSEFGLSGKTTELTLAPNSKVGLERFGNKVRQLTVFAESSMVRIAEKPRETDVVGSNILLEQLTDGLRPNRRIVVSGRRPGRGGEKVAEVVYLTKAEEVDDDGTQRTQLTLTKPLIHTYRRDTVRVNANVALASHGEFSRELLGSGDASARHQEFALKQAPLTYVAATTTSGRAPTLAVFVNDMRWEEVRTLVGRHRYERVFVTETDEEGRTTVHFGDGVEGAMAASGYNNVRAEYRKGIGEAGNVDAGTLTTLLTRPAGIASAVNPVKAEGGENAERIDDTRSNAPMTVRTFERAVSLTDYEDFAVTHPGIAKALATWMPGSARRILVTVAGLRGAAVDHTSPTYHTLFAALRTYGDPLLALEIKTYRPATFHVRATVTLAADVTDDIVMAQVRGALQRDFGFDARRFAESVSIDDIMACMHTVSGVVAVDVDALFRDGQPEQLNPALVALPPELQSDGSVTAAELLCLDEATLNLDPTSPNGAA